MALALHEQTVPAVVARNEFSGTVQLDVAAGKTLKIETSPEGENIYEGEVPEGKQWNVVIKVHITETDSI